MNNIFVINIKQALLSIFGVIILVCICLFGNSIVNNVIETATNNRLLPIYSVETEEKIVSLTFDCAWRS